MTLAEFKAWFEGYSEGIDEKPTAKQWTRIKARVVEIDGATVTERVYIDRYRPVYPGYYYPYISWNGTGAVPLSSVSTSTLMSGNASLSGQNAGQTSNFNSLTAMNALGMADAAADLN